MIHLKTVINNKVILSTEVNWAIAPLFMFGSWSRLLNYRLPLGQ